jgi:hypothetical protein
MFVNCRYFSLVGGLVVGAAISAAAQDGAVPIRGGERLIWDQPADSPDTLRTLTFTAYVNDLEAALSDAVCTDRQGPDGYECSATMPPLTPGLNAVAVSAISQAGSESDRSPTLLLDLRSESNVMTRGLPAVSSAVAVEAVQLAADFVDPTDLGTLPDGRLLVAERRGRVWIVDARGNRRLALTLDEGAVTTGEGRGLLSLAVAHDFAVSRAVFLAHTVDDGLRIARLTLAGDALLASYQVIADGLPVAATQPTALLRSAGDATLRIALDDAGSPSLAADRGTFAGKVLRLTADGRTPSDQPGGRPIYAGDVHRPVGLVAADAATTWLVDRLGDVSLLTRLTTAARGEPPSITRFALPGAMVAAGVAVDADRSTSSAGRPASLTVGSAVGARLLRVQVDGGTILRALWLDAGPIGGIRALHASASGELLALTERGVYRLPAPR